MHTSLQLALWVADFIFLIVWKAIETLEKLGFKVLVITADGASANRKFFRMHHNGSKDDICYKTKKIHNIMPITGATSISYQMYHI